MSSEFVLHTRTTAQRSIGAQMQRLVLTAAATAAVLTLLGCAPAGPSGAPTGSSTASASPSAPASATPTAAPTLLPDGTAAENLAYFDSIAGSVLAADPAAGGEAFVNGLIAAGFNKADMEVGFDRTTVDLAADSVSWAVRFNGECLIGQFGPASGGYHSLVTPILPSGSCLVGVTRPIDW